MTPGPRFDQLDLVARDYDATLDFYRRLGVPVEDGDAGELRHGQIRFDGVEIALDNEQLARVYNSSWRTGEQPRVVVGFRVETRDDVDARYADLTGAGYTGIQSPFDAFWGSRYAIVADPDGTHVGLMSPREDDRRSWPPEPAPAPEAEATPGTVTASDPKSVLHRYLTIARESLLWKLDGLSEYDVRRPLVPTGTNLLGLVKHVASVAVGYFGECFGRPFEEPLPWFDDDAEPNADMWATADESRDDIVGLWHRAWAHADATIEALPLDAKGLVPWWPEERREPTLHTLLVHMLAETNRHAGHADIVRELIDGTAGLRAGADNLPAGGKDWWEDYRDQLEHAAREAQDKS